jgi:hypothetical protein
MFLNLQNAKMDNANTEKIKISRKEIYGINKNNMVHPDSGIHQTERK